MKIEEMIAANRANCSGCEACANVCPKDAIVMTRYGEGFAYPKINPALCINCGRCDATCPALNFKAKTVKDFPPTFLATYDNDKVLRHSSSGGIFTALSEIILRDGGIIFGAGFDKTWHVVHASAKNLDELENLRGSKYVQSQIGNVYRQVRDALKDKKVLFSGTPCQCAGLKHFLGKDYENLLLVDVVCHGTPSPALWENYIHEVGYAHKITGINFRSKRNVWSGTGVSYFDIIFADQGHKMSTNGNNLYGRLFLRNLSLRPSCGRCKFRFPNVQSDLSLGDAWGVKDFAPEMYDERGVSIVFIHTDKGKDFFERANLKAQPTSFIKALSRNRLFIAPTTLDSRRKKFFGELSRNSDCLAVMQKYYDQDEEEIRQDTGKRSGNAFWKNFRAIAAQIRQKFEKNILIISTPRDVNEQNKLGDFFARSLPNCNAYILQPGENLPFVCTEYFSLLATDLKDAAALSEFVKENNISEVFVKLPLDFGDNSSLITGWLDNCDLPTRTFARKAE